jgi:hypothetical protein
MPRGTRHDLIGRLREIDGRWSPRPDDGGEWRLDVGLLLMCRARRLAGDRVRVIGVRDGFDLLAVDRLTRL